MSVRSSMERAAGAVTSLALVYALGCADETIATAPPTSLSAVNIALAPGTHAVAGVSAEVALPQNLLRLRAMMDGAPVRARWESSDTNVVRVAAVDSLVTLTQFAPGTATVTATYDANGVTWRGGIAFHVQAR